ncbi:MAG: peptidase S53 [Acidobacteria bacterium]|nr:MAG: peptidase S53 [Acidobacteriota bacterium]
MAAQKKRISLLGSDRPAPPEARAIGPAEANERIQVTVFLRRRSAPASFPAVETMGARPLSQRRNLSRKQFAAAHGAAPGDLKKIRAFAAQHNLKVIEERPERRSVVLAGTLGDFSAAFDVRFKRYEHPKGNFRGHDGPLRIPAELANIVEGVFGLDNRRQAEPHFRRLESNPAEFTPRAAGRTFTAPQVAALYQFPATANGAGQCIGILELGGGYQSSDLEAYFGQLGLATPTVVEVDVDGGSNQPTGDPNSADGEVALDIEVAGAVAPGAKIAVYFAPNTDQGFLDALTTAVHDSANNPSVISISWGGPESTWTAQALDAFNSACHDAAAMGVTVCAASGDDGSSDGVSDGQPHVDFPASSLYVLGCGGTTLSSSANRITEEDAWDDLANGGGASGGGVSVHFPLPTWQQAAYVPPAPNNRPGRGVPDVAGDAAPSTGYQITVDGAFGVVGGTSAVAPLWAGLVALLNQIVGQPVGFLNPLLYSKLPQGILNDITQGNNGQYSAGPGWDPVTGLGSPNGANIVSALQPPSKVTPQRGAKRRRPAPKRRTTKVKPKRGKKTKRSKKKR